MLFFFPRCVLLEKLIKILSKIALKFINHKSENTLGFVRKTFFLAVFGLASSIFCMLLIHSFGNGYKDSVNSKILSLDSHIEIYRYGDKTISLEKSKEITKYLDEKKLLKEHQFQSKENAIARKGELAQGIVILSVFEGNRNIFSNFLENNSYIDSDNQAIIGRHISKKLDVLTGESIYLFSIDNLNTLKPVYNTAIKPKIVDCFYSGISDLDNHLVLLDTSSFKSLFSHNNIKSIKLNLKDSGKQDYVKELLGNTLDETYNILTFEDRYSNISSSLDDILDSIFIIIFFLILVCILNIISSISLILDSKSIQIKMLKLFGLDSYNMFLIFFIITFSSIVASFLFGLSASLLIICFQNHYQIISVSSDVYLISELIAKIDFYYVLFLGCALILVGVLFALLFSYNIIFKKKLII